MRLRRLDLVRYGHFEGQSLDFGAATGDCDVTVVYGPNEAGKSTAFTAWLDLLYGFPPRNTPYAFRFDRKDLLVGAEIEVDGGTLTLQRTPKKTGSLTDGDGRGLPEHVLATHLHGLDRDAYRTRFSLNDAVLRSGGEEIAAAKGDLGRLLHAGTSGLSGLSQALEDVQSDVDAFYQKGGSKQAVPEAKRQLKALDATIRDGRLAPLRHDDLLRTRDARRADAGAARDRLSEARRALAHAEAAARRAALRAERDRVARQLDDFPDGPDLPPDAVAEIAALVENAREADARRERSTAARDAAAERLLSLVPDPDGLDLGPVIAEIREMTFDGQPLLMRVGGAEADLDRRRDERAAVARDADRLCRKITGRGLDDPPPGLRREIHDRLDAAVQRLAEAEVEARAARTTLNDAREDHGAPPPVPRGEEALSDALAAMQEDAPDLDALRETAADSDAAADRAAEGLAQDWRARLSDTGELPGDDTVAAVLSEADHAANRLAEADTRASDARAALETARARLDAAERNPGSVDAADLQRLRGEREAAWSAHRAALDAATADRFEAALRADDAAIAAHAAGADARAALLTRREELAAAEVEARTALELVESAKARNDKAMEALAEMAARLLLPPDAPGTAIRARRTVLATALDRAAAAETARSRLTRAETRHAALTETLASALADSGGDLGAGALVPAARRHLETLRGARAARAAWGDQAARIDKLAKLAERAERDARDRLAVVEDVAVGSWAEGMAPQAIRAALPDARDLAGLMEDLRDLDRRIDAMERALAAFGTAAALPRRIIGDAEGADALIRAAESRFRAAEETAREIATQSTAHEKAEEAIRTAEMDARAARGRISALLAGQEGTEGADPPAFARRLAQRDDLRADLARIDDDIARAAVGFDPARLAGEESVDDPARLPLLADAVATAEAEADTANQALGAAEEALRGALDAGGAAAADQDRAALLEDLRSGARDAAARMIGLAAARAALRRLGEDRRGPMLRETQAAFATLTGGVWERLETWREGQGERLVGISDDVPVPADGMSTGTRAQLYLALRIAGHAAFVAEAGPLPFVTDDILETFDDTRAAAALDLTAELGRRGQAILFTHHAHLVEMARTRIPDARVIALPPRK